MRNFLLASLLVTSAQSYAAGMVPVPKDEAVCGKSDAYCYEWKFSGDASLRFVATGYEDGGGFYFCRRGPKGEYRMLFAVYPAMLDPKRPGQLFWGYAWDIKDIVVAGIQEPPLLQVSFIRGGVEEDRWVPPTQSAVPYVLFWGTATQPDMKVEAALRFRKLSVESVEREAMANRSLQPTACDGG